MVCVCVRQVNHPVLTLESQSSIISDISVGLSLLVLYLAIRCYGSSLYYMTSETISKRKRLSSTDTPMAAKQKKIEDDGPIENSSVFQCLFSHEESMYQQKYYIRQSYRDILEMVYDVRELAMSDFNKGSGVVITGTPRIGKSVFLHYAAQELKKRNISFVITIGEKAYNGDYNVLSYESLSQTLKNREVVHLIDPNEYTNHVRETYAMAVFFCSPTESNYAPPYHGKNLRFLYLPVFTEDEMKECCTVLGQNFKQEYFDKWGGSFVSKYKDSCLEERLEKILEGLVLKTLLMNIDPDVFSPELASCQWMLHRCRVLKLVDDTETVDYRKFELKFPSTYVVEKILEKLQTCSFDLPIAEANPVLVGAIYEKAVIAYFSKKPNFDVQEFRKGPRSSTNPKIIITDVEYYTNKSTISALKPGTMYLPKESNKRGLDTVFIDCNNIGWVVQITMNKSHGKLDISSVFTQFNFVTEWRILLVTDPKIRDHARFSFPNVVQESSEGKYKKYTYSFPLVNLKDKA